MVNLSKLEEIKDLRKVWKDESRDFTPWLAEDENIEILGESIGIEISDCETESKSGDFSVDIFAKESNTGRKIIIENQLEDTNHKHLGQIITYASGKNAEIVIWIVKHVREDHKKAIEWLNEHTDENIGFFLCEIKLFKIGNSEIAPKFEVIEKPNNWAKEIKKNDSLTATQQQRLDFWAAFNDYAFKNKKFSREFNRRKPSTDHWLNYAIGSSSCHLDIQQQARRNEVLVEFYIPDDKELYNQVFRHKSQIEDIAELELEWFELPEAKASKVYIRRENTDLENRECWEESFDWIMDKMLRMKKAFKRYI